MSIREIISHTIESDPDITGIKVSIQNQSRLTSMGNPTEEYFGELSMVPEEYLDFEIIEKGQICVSSDEKRNGAHVLVIASPDILVV